MRFLMLIAIWLALPAAAAPLEVVATTTSMGMLAREVGGPAVQVSELVGPERDAHTLQARPSMLRILRDARLVVAVGAELEIGWLPAALSGAANPEILPGRPGYFEAAAQVPLLDAGAPADRAHGDVHPAGNPHVNLDPRRMAKVAEALGERLARLDPAQAAGYRERARAFAAAVESRWPEWQRQARGLPGALLHHKDASYLLQALGIPLLGLIEAVPGVPPSAAHLAALRDKLQGSRGVIVHTPFQPAAGAEKLASSLGWRVSALPLDPPRGAGRDGYFALVDAWLRALRP